MLFKSIFLVGAFQAALSSAAVHPQEITNAVDSINPTSRIEGFLKSHTPEDIKDLLSKGKIVSRDLERRAFGKAILENRCSYDVWAWSVDGKVRVHYQLPRTLELTDLAGQFQTYQDCQADQVH
jgi:hypothetical protein